ncbi:MAG TPA: heme-copper oxidase subunit III [Candidatus Thermoplasmatota archaeon]|nr:heme-copper oxidase subunit III [Candidatus Thermoplasmatota archaeon]
MEPKAPEAHGDGHGGDAHALHLPHGSVWPIWVAAGITCFGLALILLGHNLPEDVHGDPIVHLAPLWSIVLLAVAFLFLVVTLLGWFRQDYVWWKEGVGTGLHIPRAGTLLFISSEIFLFGALFATYFTFKGIAADGGIPWPDPNGEGHAVELPLLKTLLFSLFLFASSGTVHKAEVALMAGNKKGFDRWWLLTILLGAVFLGGQVMEYTNLIREGQTLGSSQFMTAFFMLTGTHGLHVFGGLCWLTLVHVRSRKGQFDQHRHAAPESAALYWHFVDIVWVVVLSVIYLLNHDWSGGLGGF